MGKQLSNEVTLVEQDKVPFEAIFVDEAQNMRKYPPPAKEVQDLAADIKVHGLLEPVIVRPCNVDGFVYSLVAGFQRMKAIESLIAAGEDMEVLVRVIEAEDQGATFVNIAENFRRSSISIVDLSYAIGKLKDGDSSKDEEGNITVTQPAMTLKEISEQLGMSHGNVSEIDKIRNLRTAIQKKIHSGEITKDLARQLIRMTEEEQDKVMAGIESGVASSELVQAAKTKKAKVKKRKSKGSKGEGGEGEGEGGEGNGKGSEKRPLSAKAAILVFEELAAKPKAEEGEEVAEETTSELAAREIFKQVKRLLEGKIGAKALVKQVMVQLVAA
jgi:ParB/RepB/Spo0J family partition protein